MKIMTQCLVCLVCAVALLRLGPSLPWHAVLDRGGPAESSRVSSNEVLALARSTYERCVTYSDSGRVEIQVGEGRPRRDSFELAVRPGRALFSTEMGSWKPRLGQRVAAERAGLHLRVGACEPREFRCHREPELEVGVYAWSVAAIPTLHWIAGRGIFDEERDLCSELVELDGRAMWCVEGSSSIGGDGRQQIRLWIDCLSHELVRSESRSRYEGKIIRRTTGFDPRFDELAGEAQLSF